MTPTAALTEKCLRAAILETARSRLEGRSRYAYRIEDGNPPDTVNCASFAWWVLKQHGLPVPSLTRHLLQTLHEQGATTEVQQAGDLVFVEYPESRYSFRIPLISNRVSHVGILTDKNTVVHASCNAGCVVEEDVLSFTCNMTHFRSYVSITSFHHLELPHQYRRSELNEPAAAYFELHVERCPFCRKSIET